jgi:hypothetical protein
MPKSPHDSLAILVLLGSFFVSGAILAVAKRRYSEAQQRTISSRGVDPMVVVAGFAGLLGGYYFAPVFPVWAILGAVAAITFAAFRIANHHSGQEYSSATRVLLTAGIALQLVGPLVAITLRALK